MKCAGSKGEGEASDAQPTVGVRASGDGQTGSEEDGGRGLAELRMIAVVLVLAWAFWQSLVS